MTVLNERPVHVPRSRACAALGISRTGSYPRDRSHGSGKRAPRPQPRQLGPAERERIRDLAGSERYQDASVRVIHATELNEGRVLASVSTMYRVLRADGQTRERRPQRPPQNHAVPRVIAERPNAAWTWDISRLPTVVPRRYLNLYLILDLFSRYPIAWMISAKENAALAQHLFRHALTRHQIPAGQLTVHQDRGAPMIAHSYRDFLDAFGVRRSYSRPRVSNDNPVSEAQFKTIKYSPDYPGRFRDIRHAREWMQSFMTSYQHRPHEGIGFYTPADVFHGHVATVHARREQALAAHYAAHPQRYPNGPPRASLPPAVMAINPGDGITTVAELLDQAPENMATHTPVTVTEEEPVH